MSKTSHRLSAAALALALLGAVGAAAEERKQSAKVKAQKQAVADGAKVIALQAWVENVTAATENRYGVAPTNQPVPVALGDRVRVRLVGTMIEADGDGVEVPIQATFSEAPGTRQLEILERGPNWVVVEIDRRDLGRNDGRAQLAFEVTGRYDMRQAMREGRITFDLGTRGAAGLPIGSNVTDRTRWRDAERIATLLYNGILRVEPSAVGLASGFSEDVEQIYRYGYQSVVEVAMDLAREAQQREVYRGLAAVDVAGHLYRTLLGRSGSNSQLQGDAGFVANVRTLERHGLDDLVETIVRSEEFHKVHELSRFGGEIRDR